MATFPKLKTNAIAQYPLARREQFQNQTVRFVDGREQRYRDAAGARLEWDIRLSQLDEVELAALEEFFLASQLSCRRDNQHARALACERKCRLMYGAEDYVESLWKGTIYLLYLASQTPCRGNNPHGICLLG